MTADFNLLTSKQKKVYASIESFIKLNGIPPTVREIGEMVGEKTPGAVQGILNRLEQKGVIKRTTGMARSIQLVQDTSSYSNPTYVPQIKRINRRNVENLLDIYNVVKYQPLPPDMVKSREDCFMIKCPDNSLAESGIGNEDMLFVERNCDLKEGDIILVVYENFTLLRRYYSGSSQGTFILKADSNLLDRETFSSDEVIIVGKLIGKYTSYEKKT